MSAVVHFGLVTVASVAFLAALVLSLIGVKHVLFPRKSTMKSADAGRRAGVRGDVSRTND
jgi:hypothetical protein